MNRQVLDRPLAGASQVSGAVSAHLHDTPTGMRKARGWFVAELPDFRNRSIWMLLAFVAMSVTIAGRLLDVQVRQSKSLATAAAAQHQMAVTVLGHRGRIYDANGNVLASDVAVYDIYADPSLIAAADRHSVAAQLAPILNMGTGHVEDLISQPTRFVYLIKGVSQDVRDKLENLGIDGVGAIARDKRLYNTSPLPKTSFAEPLLGFVDADGNGQYGLEQYYNQILRGQDGSDSTLRDLNGNPIVLSHQTHQDAKNGKDLQLGLDSRVQYWAEQALANGVAFAQASSGEAMVMDTKTGAIRAWAQYPAYDANNYGQANLSNFRDQSIADLYEPGSVMKVITFAGALNAGAITPQTQINEAPQTIDGYTIQDWDHRAHGVVTMQYVLDDSLNNGAIKAMEFLGHDAYYKNLLAFGIGSPTGIDLAGEQTQALAPQSQWSDIDFATTAFGQHVEVSPVEMLAAVNAVANGGVWVQPHAVQAIIDPLTGKQTPIAANTRRVMTPTAAHTLATMMTGVVEDKGGEGFNARITGFKGQVAGKTGTADEPTNGRYQGQTIVSFAGFLPADNPQFTMMVVLRYPQENRMARFASVLAAPVWKVIAQVIIDQWRILP